MRQIPGVRSRQGLDLGTTTAPNSAVQSLRLLLFPLALWLVVACDGAPPTNAGGLALGSQESCAIVPTGTVSMGAPDAATDDAGMSDAAADGAALDAAPSDAGMSDAAAGDAAMGDGGAAEADSGGGMAMASRVAPAGQLYCWGDGTARATRQEFGINDVVEVAVGQPSCLLRGDGTVECWGDNEAGELGDGTTRNRSRSAPVTGLLGAVRVQVSRFVGDAPGSACAVLAEGEVECWGSNAFGQLGDGTTLDRSRRTGVIGLGDIVQLSLGARHACAVTREGAALCWGDNARGQLGDRTTQARSRPTTVAGLSEGVVAIAAGEAHTCAVLEGGTVECWGADDLSQLGDGLPGVDEQSPREVGRLSGATSVVAGAAHSCAITDGGVMCWGDNSSTQLGALDTGEPIRRPTELRRINALGSVLEVALGEDHSCAVTQDEVGRRVYCWGANAEGQLGNGFLDPRRVPQLVLGLP